MVSIVCFFFSSFISFLCGTLYCTKFFSKINVTTIHIIFFIVGCQCLRVDSLYFIMLSSISHCVGDLCHHVLLLLYQQVIICWIDQQRTVCRKHNSSLCCEVPVLIRCYGYYVWCTLRFTHFTFSGNFFFLGEARCFTLLFIFSPSLFMGI